MLRELRLVCRQDGKTSFVDLPVGSVTVFVGPNNSGKSLLLREVESVCQDGKFGDKKWVSGLGLKPLDREQLQELLFGAGCFMPTVKQLADGSISIARVGLRDAHQRTHSSFGLEQLEKAYKDHQFAQICSLLISKFTCRLDGATRLALVEPRQSDDLKSAPTSHLTALFRDDATRGRIREITADALGLHFVIDPTGMTALQVRMSSCPPVSPSEEKGLDEASIRFHQQALDMSQVGDGIKSFVGILMILLGSSYRVLLLDEPEAFLHPGLCRRLARELCVLASQRQGNLVVATHSGDFLAGCLDSRKEVSIVRLTYSNGNSTVRSLPFDKLDSMMRDPLLRSIGVFSALFYGSAVVCEADADRVFYQEINGRLQVWTGRGIPDCILLNAHNKQTIRNIIRPLRELGIPTAGIVDLDIVTDADFKETLKAAFVPEELVRTLGILKGEVNKLYQDAGHSPKKGVECLKPEKREVVKKLIDSLAEYGVFLVPVGELENWDRLADCRKSEWIVRQFEKMSKDGDYLRPDQQESDEIWRFFRMIVEWITNSARKGMPG